MSGLCDITVFCCLYSVRYLTYALYVTVKYEIKMLSDRSGNVMTNTCYRYQNVIQILPGDVGDYFCSAYILSLTDLLKDEQ